MGNTYSFTSTQAACLKRLWEAWVNGTPDISGAALLEAADAQSSRLVDIFRNNLAWRTLIVPGATKGTYRLAVPSGDASRPAISEYGRVAMPYMIVCLGENDEPAPTNEDYWVQAMSLVDTDPEDPAEPHCSGPIRRITNLGEVQTGTHGLHCGSVVLAWEMVDAGGNLRLVCNHIP